MDTVGPANSAAPLHESGSLVHTSRGSISNVRGSSSALPPSAIVIEPITEQPRLRTVVGCSSRASSMIKGVSPIQQQVATTWPSLSASPMQLSIHDHASQGREDQSPGRPFMPDDLPLPLPRRSSVSSMQFSKPTTESCALGLGPSLATIPDMTLEVYESPLDSSARRSHGVSSREPKANTGSVALPAPASKSSSETGGTHVLGRAPSVVIPMYEAPVEDTDKAEQQATQRARRLIRSQPPVVLPSETPNATAVPGTEVYETPLPMPRRSTVSGPDAIRLAKQARILSSPGGVNALVSTKSTPITPSIEMYEQPVEDLRRGSDHQKRPNAVATTDSNEEEEPLPLPLPRPVRRTSVGCVRDVIGFSNDVDVDALDGHNGPSPTSLPFRTERTSSSSSSSLPVPSPQSRSSPGPLAGKTDEANDVKEPCCLAFIEPCRQRFRAFRSR